MLATYFQGRFLFSKFILELFRSRTFWVSLPFLLLTVCTISDTIREGDQASLLDGALQLSTGASPWHPNFYNYDKQYVAFWLLALLFKLNTLLGNPLSYLLLANLGSCLLLWSGILAVISIAPPSRLTILGVLCAITSPSLLLQIPFISTAAISSGCLFWLTWSLLQGDTRSSLWVSALWTFLAVGARGDAVLVIPYLLWLTNSDRRLGKLLMSHRNWLVVGAAILAIILGKFIYAQKTVDINSFFFYPQIFGGYFTFGLGAAGLLFIVCILALIQQSVVRPGIIDRYYLMVGTIFMLIPFVFYAPQLLSTRYWMLTLDTTLIFVCSPLGQTIIQQLPLELIKSLIGKFLVIAALVPLIVGLQFPLPKQPQLTLTHPTLFPTADGVMPLGAYASFLVPWIHHQNGLYLKDHNQAIWHVAQSAKYEVGQDGTVPILETHMPMFLRLAATLQGLKSTLISPKEALDLPFFYAESRSFTKDWIELNNPTGYQADNKLAIQKIFSDPANYVSYRQLGFGILKFGTGTHQWAQELKILNSQFKGNEYQEIPARQYFQNQIFTPSPEDLGKKLVFYSNQEFSLTLTDSQSSQKLRSTSSQNDFLSIITLQGKDWLGKSIVLGDTTDVANIRISKSAFPDWMTVDRIKK